jgi:hypothetical protein
MKQINAINFLIRKIAKTTNYDDKDEVRRNSKKVRELQKLREQLYIKEGEENKRM